MWRVSTQHAAYDPLDAHVTFDNNLAHATCTNVLYTSTCLCSPLLVMSWPNIRTQLCVWYTTCSHSKVAPPTSNKHKKKIKTIYWFLMRERARAGSPNSSSLIPFDYSALDATAGFAVYFSCFLGMQLPSSSVIFSYPNHMSCVPPIYSHCACKSVGCWCWLLLLFFFPLWFPFFPVCKF